MLKVFCGYDAREAAGFHTFCASVIERSSIPVALVPLASFGLHAWTNNFTVSRFLIPQMMGWRGRAIFMDASDMLMVGDIAEYANELDWLAEPVACVKHDYKTRHPRKYIGTPLETTNIDYERKNWASMMLINCEHSAWEPITEEYIRRAKPLDLLQFSFLEDWEIAELPQTWNVLVDEGQPLNGAKLLHWTAGIPYFEHYKTAPGADLWIKQHQALL